MEFCTNLIKLLFILFLTYAAFYLIQWMLGLCIAVRRLSRFRENQQLFPRLLTDEMASQVPVSVIIPAHNEADCICGTVESLLHNDYPSLRILVVDDGSTDDTAQQVREHFHLKAVPCPETTGTLATQPVTACYQAELGDRQLLLICKKNGGKSDALNCGINFCSSPYALMLDADTQVQPQAIRTMVCRFLSDPDTVVCAGSIGSNFQNSPLYPGLPFFGKCLVWFQRLEYFRTFYMQRLLFEQINANVIVSGAFAMFDTRLVKAVGGYRLDTIGEDMEIAMRLHAFCLSQKRPYRIAFVPEAQCYTQFPFHYRDYIRQRRRWHIGMIQSFRQHLYMLGSHVYGWAGFITTCFLMVYELLAPFIELAGLLTMAGAYYFGLLNVGFAWRFLLLYTLLSLLNQLVLLNSLHNNGVADIPLKDRLRLYLVGLLELVFFHPLNIIIKVVAFFMRGHQRRWEDIRRSHTGSGASSRQPAGKT